MKKNWLLLIGIALVIVAAVLMVNSRRSNQSQVHTPTAHHSPETSEPVAQTIPAHFETPPSRASLGPTLPPERFTGLTRDAYRAVKEIPVTIAQLPCYCHCDRGFGHKSLYSCFEDEHASHCAVCVNEALLALHLERDEKLTPAQIRDRIIAQYGH